MSQDKIIGVAVSFDGLRTHVYHATVPSQKAQFAMELMDKALITGQQDGEDAAGRAKARPATVAEIVTKACDIADEAFRQFAARGWLLAVPEPTEEQIARVLK